ncbi:hypothetical protein Tco_1335162 [Tanacetum coccineum]
MVWSGYAVLMSGKTDSIKLNNILGYLPGSTFLYSEVFKLDFSSASHSVRVTIHPSSIIRKISFGVDTAYPMAWIRRIGVSWSRDHARIRRIFLDGYDVLVIRIVIFQISSFKLQNAPTEASKDPISTSNLPVDTLSKQVTNISKMDKNKAKKDKIEYGDLKSVIKQSREHISSLMGQPVPVSWAGWQSQAFSLVGRAWRQSKGLYGWIWNQGLGLKNERRSSSSRRLFSSL